jgi:hypothetical protein
MNRTLGKLYDYLPNLFWFGSGRSQMTAIVRFLSRTFSETNAETETLKMLIIFCGVGLMASLLWMLTRGLDSSVGFF